MDSCRFLRSKSASFCESCGVSAYVSHSLDLHGNPLPAEMVQHNRYPLVLLKSGVAQWSGLGLTTDELERRVLALTDAECASITKYVVCVFALGLRC